MARFRGKHSLAMDLEIPHERQLTFADRLKGLARRAEVSDPTEPARAVFFIVLALMGLGLMLQVSHASTTIPRSEFGAEVRHLVQFRVLGLLTLLLAYRAGLRGVERFVPALTAIVIVMLLAVYLPVVHEQLNGSRRWIRLPLIPFTVQPSELARVVAVLWVARRCVMLGSRVEDVRRGYLPMLAFGAALFLMILFEPDVGGALLFILCFMSTMWVGGARRSHVAGSMLAIGGAGLLFGASAFAYVRERIDVWLGYSTNDQVTRAAEAMASGDLFGVGLTHGGFRNQSLQYMQSDYAFSLVGEELGYVGLVLVIGLFLGYLYHSLRLVSSLRNHFSALAAFGLLVSVAFQAMLHLQVVTGLAPPKGMNLPFISEGGSALVASCLAVGLALGAVRSPVRSPVRASSRG